MVGPIFFTLGTILRPLEVAPGASAPLCPPLVTPLIHTVPSMEAFRGGAANTVH